MIAKFSVKKAYTIIVGIILVIILGVVAYTKMTVDLLPDMELPYAVVITTYPGASPEAVETAVTKPIEQAIATIDNIENIQSMSSENYSMVMLEFNSDTNMDTATIDMREKLDQVSGFFDDSVGNPMIMKLNPNMMPVMVSAVDLEGSDIVALSDYVENTLSPSIEGLEGVASVTTMGTVEESVQVIIRKDKVEEANQKVKEALDKKFADAKQALNDGKNEISNGKSQLASGQKTASEQFAKAQIQINDTKYELLTSEKDIQSAQKQLEEEEKNIKQQKTDLEQGITSLQEVLTSYQTLTTQQAQLTAAVTANPEDVASKAQLEAINSAIAAMESQIASQKDQNGQALTFTSLPGYITYLQTSKAQIDAGLTEIANQKAKLKKAQAKITKGKEKVDDGYSELKEKESETNSKMTQAQVQLEQGEQKIAEQEESLDEAEDTAYDSADLDNIITVSMIEGILTAQNFDYPAGYVTEDDVDYLVRVGDKFDDVDSLSDFVLLDMGMDDVDPIRLSDVADVLAVDNSDKIYTRVNGNPGVILSIAKQNEYSTKEVSDRISDKFEELSKSDDKVTFTTLMDQGMYIDLVVDSVLSNLVYGAILAVIILFFFLKDIRPTGIIAVSIPVSVVFAIVLMYFSGITLNVISLSGLALGVGMLVDNSIVVIENIYRLRNEGYPVKDAAIEGAKQMTGAITASTLTTVCVFLPIVFTTGITKQLFTDMGLTIAYSLLASLIVAVTFVPMVASKTFEHVSEKKNKTIERISDFYASKLPVILDHKAIVMIGVVGLLVLSAVLSLGRGFSFFPAMDSTQMSMTLTMPEETKTLQETAELSDKVIDSVLEIPDIETIGAMVGGNSMSMIGLGSDDSFDSVSYYIECKEDKKHTNDEIANMILEKTQDYDCEISVSASNMDMSSMMTEGIVVQVKGKDLDELQRLAAVIGDKLGDIKGLTEIDNGITDAAPEYRLVVDKDKAAGYGLTVAQVYQAVQEKLKESSSATTLSTTSKDYPVYVSDEEQEAYTLRDVENIEIEGTKGEEKKKVKVGSIADVQDANSLATINRLNQNRYISISAKVKDGYTTTAVSGDVKKALAKIELPDGYRIDYNGENETVMEAMEQVILMLILAILFMYLIMVAQFQSLKGPFIIMFTIPLAFTGGFAALYLTGKDVSIIAMIGMVMLCGVIVNNGIVFVDSVNQLREGGMEIRDAIVLTGRNRLRPIVMTALTTILGLSTMAMGIGMGSDMAQPMALVVIGGLIYGTVLTLAVVPCIYESFYGKKKKKHKIDTNVE